MIRYVIMIPGLGYLMPYQRRGPTYQWTDDLDEANVYKSVSGTMETLRYLTETGRRATPIVRAIRITRTPESEVTLTEIFAKELVEYGELLMEATEDCEAMDDKRWKRFMKLNRALSALELVEEWKR